jgi:hypothetical protein
MPTNQIPQKRLTVILKEEERESDHEEDGRISSSNLKITTGQ